MRTASKQNNYNRLVPFYDILAKLVFGQRLLHAQQAFLDQIPQNSRILIIGGGTGEILSDLKNRGFRIDFLDHSEKMIAKAAARLGNDCAGVRFICEDVRQAPKECYDAVLAFFFFDQFENYAIHDMVKALSTRAYRGTVLLVADFLMESNTGLFDKLLLKIMYWCFRLATNIQSGQLWPVKEVLEAHGWVREGYVETAPHFIYSSQWRLND